MPGPVFDVVRDFGAIPGTACESAFQAAADAAKASNHPALIRVPANYLDYIIHKPIISDSNCVEWQGDGWGSKITCQNSSAFTFGVKRGLSSDHWVDLYGNLDATAVTAIGQKWGYRTLNDARLCLDAHHWGQSFQQFTLDFIIKFPTLPTQSQIGLFGCVEQQKAAPWYVGLVNQCTQLTVQYQDSSNVVHNVTFPFDKTLSAYRCSIQTDLVSGQVRLWINGKEIQPLQPITLAFQLWQNSTTPNFGVGAVSDQAVGWGDFIGGPPNDLMVFGLRANNALIYDSDASGNQIRRDGKVITDAARVLWNEATTYARLMLDSPTELVHSYGGGNHSWGYFILVGQTNLDGIRVSQLNISCNSPYGQVIALGGLYGVKIDDCSISGGAQNIGCLGGWTTYLIKLEDVDLGYSDCCFYGWENIIHGSSLSLFPNKTAIRLKYGTAFLDKLFISGESSGIIFDAPFGGIFALRGGNADFEGVGPQCYFKINATGTVKSSLRLEDWQFGKLAVGGSDVLLTGTAMKPGTTDPLFSTYSIKDVWPWGGRQLLTNYGAGWVSE